MPNTKSAKKELRKSSKRKVYNNKIKGNLRELVKGTKKQIESKDPKVATDVKATIVAIDKAVQKGIMKKQTGSRKISRLQKAVNKVK